MLMYLFIDLELVNKMSLMLMRQMIKHVPTQKFNQNSKLIKKISAMYVKNL